ncbi:MAG: hypothetical protein JWO52_4041 [Gammaproteobacteria bacterium]|nr:hypothetical protein [Gammaproteobacteria bacterium]
MSDVKLTLNPQTPSQQAVAAASETHTVTDSKGRRIVLKKPGVLKQFRLVEALGEVAENRVYMRMALPLLYVTDIDGEAVVSIMKKSELEALIQRLGDEGLETVMKAMDEHYGTMSDPEADKAALKK